MDSNIVFWFSHKFYLSLDPPQLGWRTSLPYLLSFPKIFLMSGFNAWPKLAHSGTDFCYQLLACTHRQTWYIEYFLFGGSEPLTWLCSLDQHYFEEIIILSLFNSSFRFVPFKRIVCLDCLSTTYLVSGSVRERFQKTKWKSKMAFAMKGGWGVSRAINVF